MQALIVFTFNSNYKEVVNNIGKELLSKGYKLNNYKKDDISETIVIHDLNNLQESLGTAVDSIKDSSKSLIIVKDSDLTLNDLVYNLFNKRGTQNMIKFDYDKTKKQLLNYKPEMSTHLVDVIEFMYKSGYVVRYINEELSKYGYTFKDFVSNVIPIKKDSKVIRLSDRVKKMIASRDESGVTRKNVSDELGINYKTIQRACSKFGKTKKNSATSSGDNIFEFVTKDFKFQQNTLFCPKCGRKTNNIDENLSNTKFYCRDCFEEYSIRYERGEESLYRVKWELTD